MDAADANGPATDLYATTPGPSGARPIARASMKRTVVRRSTEHSLLIEPREEHHQSTDARVRRFRGLSHGFFEAAFFN